MVTFVRRAIDDLLTHGANAHAGWHIRHLEITIRRVYAKSNLKQLSLRKNGGVMKRYVIEREIPKVGTLERQQLREVSAKSNEALAKLAPKVQWVESYVADNKTFCVYLAEDEAVIRKHGELSGIPVSTITEIGKIIDPTMAVEDRWP
jgi:hypothetical protein